MHSLEETQAYFDTYFKNTKKDAFHLKDLLIKLSDWYLADQTDEKLSQVYQILQKNESSILFQTDSTMWRIHYLFEMMSMEVDRKYIPFSSGCNNATALIDKLLLTILSMRRLELQLDETFYQEGVAFLSSQNLSPLAYIYICNQELFVQRDIIYSEIKKIYQSQNLIQQIAEFNELLTII